MRWRENSPRGGRSGRPDRRRRTTVRPRAPRPRRHGVALAARCGASSAGTSWPGRASSSCCSSICRRRLAEFLAPRLDRAPADRAVHVRPAAAWCRSTVSWDDGLGLYVNGYRTERDPETFEQIHHQSTRTSAIPVAALRPGRLLRIWGLIPWRPAPDRRRSTPATALLRLGSRPVRPRHALAGSSTARGSRCPSASSAWPSASCSGCFSAASPATSAADRTPSSSGSSSS